jgi:hypothetical protein
MESLPKKSKQFLPNNIIKEVLKLLTNQELFQKGLLRLNKAIYNDDNFSRYVTFRHFGIVEDQELDKDYQESL